MEKIKFLSLWILISGIIISIIGIAHNSFAPVMYHKMLTVESVKDLTPGFIYFFVLGGSAFLFAGLLSIFSSFGLKKTEKWAWVIAISSGIFVAIGSIAAIAFAKFGNPMIYIQGICAISNIVLLLIFKKAFKN